MSLPEVHLVITDGFEDDLRWHCRPFVQKAFNIVLGVQRDIEDHCSATRPTYQRTVRKTLNNPADGCRYEVVMDIEWVQPDGIDLVAVGVSRIEQNGAYTSSSRGRR